mmetsp:Transcript_31002/g.29613  ORF Transcript_31002/g.29613 Transcript_31002/m.29613 type:complete len:166 (+) Transcript_31002:81-578(+)|eukprot:CAMPEP_0119042134 /NCGR_PEP_ID=MMETSP1177-20130426/14383_1 /TAXON_ID=2985 /ORGANISM="Ochromonas sp, Strain CCMP1899" /LENGTH=165 /DNA_ID=CAMNT_0007008701 /DNA_START=34 /DNA_END=531 /DNA_ORIENTATION=+
MTEVSQSVYGVFVDCIEEVSFDGAVNDQNEDWVSASTLGKRRRKDASLFDRVFKAVEKINMSESTDSLTSYASVSSMNSGKEISQADLAAIFTPAIMMEAVQSLTLNNYGSSNSLASMDTRGSQSIQTPNNIIQFFFKALENFINETDESDTPPNNSADDFPKFC